MCEQQRSTAASNSRSQTVVTISTVCIPPIAHEKKLAGPGREELAGRLLPRSRRRSGEKRRAQFTKDLSLFRG